MQSRAITTILCFVFTLTLAVKSHAATIFAGSFSLLSVQSATKDISINYPRRGKNGLCGIELKSNVIILSTNAWQRLSDALEVREFHDDEQGEIVKPRIESNYSPTLRYVFSRFNSDFASLRFKTKNNKSLESQINLALADAETKVNVIAVSYSCSEQ